MAAVNVTFPGNLAQVATAADLRGIPSSLIPSGIAYLVNELEGIFEFDSGSLAADDGVSVIRPDDRSSGQTGRWQKNASGLGRGPAGATGPSNNTRVDLAALKAAAITDKTSLYNGSLYTWTTGDYTGQADDFRIVKADSTALSVGAWVRTDGPLYAGNFGVFGNGTVDDTVACQAFLNLCYASGLRTANFGSLRPKITGPLTSRVGIDFETSGYGAGMPGFIATFAPGSSMPYWALTFFSAVDWVNVTVIGVGTITVNETTGELLSDTRDLINGVRFGTTGDANAFLLGRNIAARTYNLGGTGIQTNFVNDSTFTMLSAEHCGNWIASGVNAGDYWAIDINNGGGSAILNESYIARIQAERAVCRGLKVSGGTLSNRIAKVHSERLAWKAGDTGYSWDLSGQNSFGPIRLNSTGAARARLSGQNTSFEGLLAEPPIIVDVQAQPVQYLSLRAASGVYRAILNQTGLISFTDSQIDYYASASSGYHTGRHVLTSCQIGVLELGNTADRLSFQVRGGTITDLHIAAGAGAASATLTGVQATLTATLPGTSLVCEGGTALAVSSAFTLGYTRIDLDRAGIVPALAGSALGTLTLDNSAIVANNFSYVQGNLTKSAGANQTLFDMTSGTRGAVTGYANPDVVSPLLGTLPHLTYAKNLAAGSVADQPGFFLRRITDTTGNWNPAHPAFAT